MDKYDALFIRAVKHSSSEFRLRRLYQRFYNNNFNKFHLAQILTSIVERYNMASVTKLVQAFDPNDSWKYLELGENHHDKVVGIMMTFIWCTPIKQIEGYPRCAYYRNKFPEA